MNRLIKITLSFLICISLICFTGCKEDGTGLIPDADISESSYELGDYMGDYTVTDIKGNSYTFSELLKEKKAIVLNLWFINCVPCQMEFPYLQKAYDAYSDDVAVIAINPVDSKEKDIERYAFDNKLTFPMVMADKAWGTAFGITGFPTTIVIDRYGSIAFMHTGSIPVEGQFEKLFEYFISDDYEQTTINSISDIK